jgi:hypothetical protein
MLGAVHGQEQLEGVLVEAAARRRLSAAYPDGSNVRQAEQEFSALLWE